LNDVWILATGPELLREGVRGIEPVIEELIASARSEIHIVAYLLTRQAARILDLTEKAAERGVRVTIIINRLETQDEFIRSKLNFLRRSSSNITVYNFSDLAGRQLHAKVIIADRIRAVIGSANLSWGGMVTNYEIGVMLEGDAVWKLAALVDSFITAMQGKGLFLQEYE